MASADAHAWVATHESVVIGQLDIYTIAAGELGKYFQAGLHDAVIQYRIQQSNHMHRDVLSLFMEYYFAKEKAGHLYAQANIYDGSTCRLYESAGFIFQQNCMLSSEAVSLYLMTRTRFSEEYRKGG